MNRTKYVVFFLLLPLATFSQNVLVRNLYPIDLQHPSKDSVKSISYPLVYCKPVSVSSRINSIIKASLFPSKIYDTAQSAEKLLQDLYRNDKAFKMLYIVNRNKNGFLSITINFTQSKGDKSPPIYLNFDLTTGKLVTLRDFLKSKNDSISFNQAIIPGITDSVRLFEVKIDKNNPKYSEIIQQFNDNLGTFRHHYPSDFIMNDREIIVYFDCILPASLLPYYHVYHVSFTYKTLRNIFKPDILNKLLAL